MRSQFVGMQGTIKSIERRVESMEHALTLRNAEMAGLEEYVRQQELSTILDKTVEKIAYLGAFFLNFVADRFFPPPLPLEAVLLGLQKKAGSLSICRKQL